MDTPQPSHAETPPATTSVSPPRRPPRAAIVATVVLGVLYFVLTLGAEALAPPVRVIAEQVEVGLGLDILPGETKSPDSEKDGR